MPKRKQEGQASDKAKHNEAGEGTGAEIEKLTEARKRSATFGGTSSNTLAKPEEPTGKQLPDDPEPNDPKEPARNRSSSTGTTYTPYLPLSMQAEVEKTLSTIASQNLGGEVKITCNPAQKFSISGISGQLFGGITISIKGEKPFTLPGYITLFECDWSNLKDSDFSYNTSALKLLFIPQKNLSKKAIINQLKSSEYQQAWQEEQTKQEDKDYKVLSDAQHAEEKREKENLRAKFIRSLLPDLPPDLSAKVKAAFEANLTFLALRDRLNSIIIEAFDMFGAQLISLQKFSINSIPHKEEKPLPSRDVIQQLRNDPGYGKACDTLAAMSRLSKMLTDEISDVISVVQILGAAATSKGEKLLNITATLDALKKYAQKNEQYQHYIDHAKNYKALPQSLQTLEPDIELAKLPAYTKKAQQLCDKAIQELKSKIDAIFSASPEKQTQQLELLVTTYNELSPVDKPLMEKLLREKMLELVKKIGPDGLDEVCSHMPSRPTELLKSTFIDMLYTVLANTFGNDQILAQYFKTQKDFAAFCRNNTSVLSRALFNPLKNSVSETQPSHSYTTAVQEICTQFIQQLAAQGITCTKIDEKTTTITKKDNQPLNSKDIKIFLDAAFNLLSLLKNDTVRELFEKMVDRSRTIGGANKTLLESWQKCAKLVSFTLTGSPILELTQQLNSPQATAALNLLSTVLQAAVGGERRLISAVLPPELHTALQDGRGEELQNFFKNLLGPLSPKDETEYAESMRAELPEAIPPPPTEEGEWPPPPPSTEESNKGSGTPPPLLS